MEDKNEGSREAKNSDNASKTRSKTSLFSSAKARTALQGKNQVKATGPEPKVVQAFETLEPAANIDYQIGNGEKENIQPAQKKLEQLLANLQFINIDAIDPNPFYNMNQSENKNSSIKEDRDERREGLVKKLAELWSEGQMREFVALLRPHPDQTGRYQLTYGHLRVRAAALAGLSGLQAIVQPLSDDEMLLRLLLENHNRAEVSKVETAAQVRYLREGSSMSFKALGELFNLPLGTVYDLYYLSLAPARFLELVAQQPQFYQAVSEMVRQQLPAPQQEAVWQFLQHPNGDRGKGNRITPRQLREKVKELLLLVNQKS